MKIFEERYTKAPDDAILMMVLIGKTTETGMFNTLSFRHDKIEYYETDEAYKKRMDIVNAKKCNVNNLGGYDRLLTFSVTDWNDRSLKPGDEFEGELMPEICIDRVSEIDKFMTNYETKIVDKGYLTCYTSPNVPASMRLDSENIDNCYTLIDEDERIYGCKTSNDTVRKIWTDQSSLMLEKNKRNNDQEYLNEKILKRKEREKAMVQCIQNAREAYLNNLAPVLPASIGKTPTMPTIVLPIQVLAATKTNPPFAPRTVEKVIPWKE